ncbi:carbon-nitrogen hydrolase family protein [Candidatus Woesearchaeota archaeon]|nr:carbon-nitrogen hydrolase family protein [Candidatus Woesearchaeota archaeon]
MVKVAAAQIPVTKNSLNNLNKIIKYIKKAASKNADIVCFPEGALIRNKNKDSVKKIPIKKYVDIIKNTCKEKKIHCIFGSNILKNNKLYNSAFFIDDNGKLIYRYDKVNLFIKEKIEKKIKAGKRNKIIKTKFGNIGIIICWDIAHPEYVKELAKNGAWVIFCPSYIKNYGRELESYLLLPYARAFESSCYFVSCDSANKECAQYSVICGPSRIYSEIKGKEGIIFAELDRRKIDGVRKRYKLT